MGVEKVENTGGEEVESEEDRGRQSIKSEELSEGQRRDERQEQAQAEEEEEEAPVRCASAPPTAASPAVCAPQSA